MTAFPLTTDFLRRLDQHNLSAPAFRLYLELLGPAVHRRDPTIHELPIFVFAVLYGESTDPYPASALELARAGLLIDVYDARGNFHTFVAVDALPYCARTSPHRRPIPDHLRNDVYKRDNYCCLTCGSTTDLTLDHIVPWSIGGTDDEDNLQTLCGSCNSRKGDRLRRPLTAVGSI